MQACDRGGWAVRVRPRGGQEGGAQMVTKYLMGGWAARSLCSDQPEMGVRLGGGGKPVMGGWAAARSDLNEVWTEVHVYPSIEAHE